MTWPAPTSTLSTNCSPKAAYRKEGQFSCSRIPRSDSPTLTPPGPALLIFLGKVQALLSRVLQLLRDSTSSYVILLLRLELLPVISGKGRGGRTYFPHPCHHISLTHATIWLTRGGGQFSRYHAFQVSSPVSSPRESPLLYCPGEVQRQCSLSHDPRASSPTCHKRLGIRKGGDLLSLTHSTIWQMRGGDRSPMNVCRIKSPTVPSTGSALMCHPGEVQGPSS